MAEPTAILISAGGTGGGVYPAVAVSEALRRIAPTTPLHFIGSAEGMERKLINLHFLQPGDVREVFGDERSRNPAQVETLAAGENRRQNFFRVGRCEHELHMRGRLFQSFQQRIERRRGEHVNFVNDVDLERRIGGRVFAGLAEFADLLHAVITRAVNFQHVERAAFGDFLHARIIVIEIHLRAAGAVQAFGEDAGNRGFPCAARPAEQVSVRDTFLGDGVGERLGDVFLADDIGETLRAVFSGDDLITHAKAKDEG